MTNAEVLSRARSMLGSSAIYRLGAGGRDPLASSPLDPDAACDCSGFALWCCGMHRWTKAGKYLESLYGSPKEAWLDTSAIWADAQGRGVFFVKSSPALLGDLLVYPDKGGRQGHVGIVSYVDGGGRIGLVIHCSRENEHFQPLHAIQETSTSVFRQRLDSITCRLVANRF